MPTSQQWTGYNDGTLRMNGKCLDIGGPEAGATVKVAACAYAATQTCAIGRVSGNDFGSIANMATGIVLTDPESSTVNGTRLVMEHGRGDLSGPWCVSYHHYLAGQLRPLLYAPHRHLSEQMGRVHRIGLWRQWLQRRRLLWRRGRGGSW